MLLKEFLAANSIDPQTIRLASSKTKTYTVKDNDGNVVEETDTPITWIELPKFAAVEDGKTDYIFLSYLCAKEVKAGELKLSACEFNGLGVTRPRNVDYADINGVW